MSLPFDPNTTPSLMPPDGVIPNFQNPDSNAWISTNVTEAFLTLMVLCMILRLYSRVIVIHKFGADDILSVVAAASIVAVCGILLSLNDHPNGRHLWDVPFSVLTDSYLQINFTFVLLSAAASLLVKLSLLMLYLRIFNPVQAVKITIYACIGVLTAFYFSTIIAELVVGIPRNRGGWQEAQVRYGPFGLTISVVRGVFGVVSDFVILFIPITQLIKLSVPLGRKIVLLGVFLTGLLACASSIATTVFRFGELDNPDYTWANTLPNAFAIIELTVGHICCSLPTLPPLITLVSKSKTVQSIIRHIRSTGARNSDGDDSVSGPSDTAESQRLPPIRKGGLTGLRSFIRKAGFTNVPTKPTSNSTNGPSYYDLESIDVDYHAQLKTTATAQRPVRPE
ncbi:hypothetical protein F4808DRAFT_443454 [Astrocystis sublimbata]|nr:hypothetical protein F4808DRAFT_443454 [Astrocystis sublimbata]